MSDADKEFFNSCDEFNNYPSIEEYTADIRRWLTAHQTMNEKQYGWNVIGTTDQAFYNYETGPVVVYSSNKFIAPRDYLDPFDAEEILISGMVQNPGWGGR